MRCGPYIEELSDIAPIFVSAYPNAGLPDPLSETGFPETPETLAPTTARVGGKRLAQYRRRLLRHDARSTSGPSPTAVQGASRRASRHPWSPTRA